MKIFTTIMKILAALAAVVGAIYVAATYGDKIVAWAKKMLPQCPECNCGSDCKCGEEDIAEEPAAEEAVVEEIPVEEVPVVEVDAEAPAEEPAENEPVADDADFEG